MGGRARQIGSPSIRGVLPVAGQSPDEDVAHKVHQKRHQVDDRPGSGAAAPFVSPPPHGDTPHPHPQELAGQEGGHRRKEAGDGDDRHIAVADMRDLVRQHRLQLTPVEPLQQPPGHRHHRASGAASGREGVGHRRRDDGHPRLGQIRQRRQPSHHVVQLGRFLRAYLPGSGGPHDQPVGQVDLGQQHEAHDEHQGEGIHTVSHQHADKEEIDRPQQQHRQKHPRCQARIGGRSHPARHLVLTLLKPSCAASAPSRGWPNAASAPTPGWPNVASAPTRRWPRTAAPASL